MDSCIRCIKYEKNILTENKVVKKDLYIHLLENNNFIILEFLKGREFTLLKDYKDIKGRLYYLQDYYISTRPVDLSIMSSLNSRGFNYRICTVLENSYFLLRGTYQDTIYDDLLKTEEKYRSRIVHPFYPPNTLMD